MKKFIAIALALVMCLGLFAACDKQPAATPVDGLANAAAYLKTMYKESPETTAADYTVVSSVPVGDVKYDIEWTTEIVSGTGEVKITKADNGMFTVDVDEKNPEELVYKLIATVKDASGNTKSVSFNHKVPAAIIIDEGMSYEEIVELAYKLEDGLALEGTFRLYGTIVKIPTAWSEDYKNITVDIQIGDLSDKIIQCYRLKGDGAKDLKVGDTITVEGNLKNYKGTIEFDAGCQLLGVGAEVKDQTAILDAAYALEDGVEMTEAVTLTGVISKIPTAWSEDYKNITVDIIVGGDTERPIQCYRLAGDGAKELAVGDTVTVTGTLTNYKGTIEFKQGCTLDSVVKGEGTTETPDTTTPPANNTDSKVTVVTAPVAGTAYKFYLYHETNAAPMFMTGNTANKDYYLESTTDASAAIDVYLEEATGGYYLYFTKDGAKTYIDIIVSGTYINIKLADAPNVVYTWNAEYNTLTTTVTVDGAEAGAYIGAYGTYNTFSASKDSYLGQSGSFCGNLVTVD